MSTTDDRPDALLAGLFDANPDGIVAFDRELRYTAWSSAMERMTGMPAARVVGRVMHEVFPFLEAIGERAGAEAALRGETALAPERPFRVAETGEEGWAETRYAPLRDAEGRVVGGVATVRDVTGRVRAGEAAAGRSAVDILESMGDGFSALDREWRYTYVNRAAEVTVRRPRAELLGRVIWELFPEIVGTVAERELRRAMAAGVPVAYEVEMPSLDVRLEVRAFPFAQGLAVYSRDVTRAHRAAEELRAGEERLRALVEATKAERDLLRRVLAQLPAAVAVYEGPEHVFAAVSDRYHRIVGRREVVGLPIAAVLPELAEQGFVALLDGVYATGEPAAGTAVRADWDDDGDGRVEEHLVDYAYHPLRDAAGRVTGVVAHVTDVGERERAARERDEARREAEARAEEAAVMAMQLQEQAAELELQVEESQALAEELQAVNLELTDASAEAERRAAELRATLEGIPDAVLIGTREGLSLANEAALALFGVASVEELNAAHASLVDRIRSRDPLTGEPVPLAEQPFARALAGERSVREVVGRHPATGEDRVIRIAAAPVVVEGGGVGAVAVGSDVTEQRRAQDAQRILADASRALASSLEYEATVQAVARMAVPALADWCFVEMREADGSVRMVAAAHRDPSLVELAFEVSRRYPIDPEAPYGTGHVLRTGEPELAPVIPEEVLDAVAHDPDHAELLRRMRFRSSLSVPIAVRGRAEGVISLVSSDSGRLYGEDDLALAMEVARRAAVAIDNARLYEEARSANVAKAGFLATMSHELRTPLNAMLGYVDLLLLGIPEVVPPGAARHVERIRLASQHLLSIIEEILTFSRIEAGRETVEPEEVDLLALAGEVSAIIEPLAAEKGLDFAVPERVEPPVLVTDPRKLRQILVNLLGNAVKFTREGRVAFEVEPDGGHVHLRVRDTGIGISPADLEVIFEPFRQVDSTKTRHAGGTGLGLSVSRKLARLLGGDVTVESRPGEGSVFTISLPLSRPGG